MTLLLLIFVLSVLRFAAATRLETCAQIIGLQGILLFFLALQGIHECSITTITLISLETLLIKGIFLPLFLIHMLKRNQIFRDVEPYIPQINSLAYAILMLPFCLMAALFVAENGGRIHLLEFVAAMHTILLSLLVIITRRKLVTHVIAFVMMENGIFLFSLALLQELPVLIQLGVLMDAFVAVFLFALFLRKVRSSFDDLDICQLTNLRD